MIAIPAGSTHEDIFKVEKKGNSSVYLNQAAGDLLVKINLVSSGDLSRKGNDIVQDVTIDLSKAILGVRKEIETL